MLLLPSVRRGGLEFLGSENNGPSDLRGFGFAMKAEGPVPLSAPVTLPAAVTVAVSIVVAVLAGAGTDGHHHHCRGSPALTCPHVLTAAAGTQAMQKGL